MSALTDRDVVRYLRHRAGIRPEIDDRTSSPLTQAASAIVSHIPTEVVTLYVVLTGLAGRPNGRIGTGQWVLLWIVLAITPVVTWLLYANKLKRAGEPLPLAFAHWPWPSLVFGTVAFLIWAFSLPGTPFATFDWYRPPIGAGVLLIGTLLIGLVSDLARRPE